MYRPVLVDLKSIVNVVVFGCLMARGRKGENRVRDAVCNE